ncbi:hypothetical protein NLG97_g3940 [Lecanicillium saksenae]|uniref:Uncharacterized protein n=1 Tax=Lecanicillium saksenae TaxID=468837 RepID=A0ACC1QZA6_9HYPO|nr:hypothetical protein NLG97_g3940 [Lecanicillium saksenae]
MGAMARWADGVSASIGRRRAACTSVWCSSKEETQARPIRRVICLTGWEDADEADVQERKGGALGPELAANELVHEVLQRFTSAENDVRRNVQQFTDRRAGLAAKIGDLSDGLRGQKKVSASRIPDDDRALARAMTAQRATFVVEGDDIRGREGSY